jgi:predicted acyltransferase
MGDNHLYHGEGVAFDPEGILSNMPAIVNIIVGYYVGKFIQEKGKGYETVARLALMGCVFIFIALTWNMSFPIGKKLWTSPFVLLTTGIDMVMISAFIYVVEVRAWNKYNWTSFFTTVGKNPLAIYILSEVLIVTLWMINIGNQNVVGWINDVFFQKIAPGAMGSLLFAITYMLICWSVGKILDKKKIYIRV